MIGTLGNVAFVASADFMRTFNNFQQTTTARFHEHERVGKKPKLEFLGPAPREGTYAMRLDATFGINPEREAEGLRVLCESGQHVPLIIGGRFKGDFVVLSVAENQRAFNSRGRAHIIDLNVTLKEYTP